MQPPRQTAVASTPSGGDEETKLAEGEDAAAILSPAPSALFDLAAIGAPVHIVAGSADRIVAQDRHGHAPAALLRNARLTGIEGAGPMLHHNHIARLAGIVRAELERAAA